MALEGAITSPPNVSGSSFSIENLLNLSGGTTEKPPVKLSTSSLSCDSLSWPSFPFVPRVVRPFAYHGQNLPLCTPEPGFNFGEIPYSHSVPYIHQFPISNNGPPLGKWCSRGKYLSLLSLFLWRGKRGC